MTGGSLGRVDPHLIPFAGEDGLKDTVAVYQEAMRVYERLQKGEDMETVGKALAEKDKGACRLRICTLLAPDAIPESVRGCRLFFCRLAWCLNLFARN